MLNKRNNSSNETSPDGDKAESLCAQKCAENYGSVRSEDERDWPRSQLTVPICGLTFYVMAFFGFFCVMLLRECLSVAIVAMVNQTSLVTETVLAANVTGLEQCPTDPELQHEGGEFDWDRNQQGIVLAAFYYGYTVTQVPGGMAADHFGGKWLFGGCILLSSVISLLSPSAARIHIGVLIALRVLAGLGEGVMLPAIHALLARWSVPQYRSLVVSLIFVGTDAGVIVGMLLSGMLCDYSGWPSVFYLFGVIGCVWSFAWFYLCHSSPSTHPRISKVELDYWQRVIGTADLATHTPTPWKQILTSVPVWALALAFFANNWGYFTMVICLPLFMHDVLGFDMTRNGLYSAVPFLASLLMIPLNGLFVDWLRSPGKLSTNAVRKIFCAVGFGLFGCFLVLTGYIGCNRALAVATVFVVMACSAVGFTSVAVTQLDLAPLHAGKIMGLTYTVANLGSIAAPHAVSALTFRRSTRSEWQSVFFVTAAVLVAGAIQFVVFGSGDRQSWAD